MAFPRPRRLRRLPSTREPRDEAQTMVVEAFLVGTIFLGVVSYVTLAGGSDAARETDLLAPAASDALDALIALRDAGDKPVLDALIADAWACTENAASSSCTSSARGAANSRLRAYLPPGATYDLEVLDSAAAIPLVSAGEANGPAVGASAVHVPSWSYGIAAPTVSCRDASAHARAAAIFLQNGNPSLVRSVAFAEGVAATRAGHVWTATFAPAASSVVAQATMREGALTAATAIDTCATVGRAALLEAAMASATYDLTPTDGGAMLPGKALVVRHDLSAASGIATLSAAALRVYAPTSSAPMWSVPLAPALTGTATWAFPSTALHGCYATELRATWILSDATTSEEVVTRSLGAACVALPSGHVPPEPMYRITLRAWSQEWSG